MCIKLFLVTRNKHKFEEAKILLEEFGVDLEMAGIDKLEIQSHKLEDIAWRAAIHAYATLRKPVVVDDSGLFIKALNGFPGPYSSYVFKTLGLEGILRLLEGVNDRRACFKTAVAAIIPPVDIVVTGSVCGYITRTPRGAGGFGFDPIFVPEGEDRTFAEMSLREKNRYSHRARAFRELGRRLVRLGKSLKAC